MPFEQFLDPKGASRERMDYLSYFDGDQIYPDHLPLPRQEEGKRTKN